jgi:hypothetical protein
VRLIPDGAGHDNSETAAIKIFFNHRLPKDKDEAKKEWLHIVEADHHLWTHISTAKKELIRSFLNMINFEILKRLRPSSTFNFSAASIGNLFLTGYVCFHPLNYPNIVFMRLLPSPVVPFQELPPSEIISLLLYCYWRHYFKLTTDF